METHSKFSLHELVIYRNEVYIVEAIHAINWFYNDPIVYGLVKVSNSNKNQRNQHLLVREPLVSKAPKGSYEKRKNRQRKATSI